jgi:hypothetical protein
MAATESPALAAFVGKWLLREPEMAIAEVFCPPERKPLYRAWGGLLHELREATFELSDARVTEVKTAWWAEELIGVGQGRHRHPLTEVVVMVDCDAPWSALGRSLLELPDAGSRYGTTAEVIDSLMPIARSALAVESALFAVSASDDSARALVIHWLLQRLPHGLATEDQARIPLHLFARHGLSAAQLVAGQGEALLRDWAAELLNQLPADVAGAGAFRRSRVRFDNARLQRLAAGRGFTEPPALATLWRAWRVARPL